MRNLLYVSLILVAVIGIGVILALMFFRNLPKPTPLTDVPLLLEGVKIEPPVTSEKVRSLIAKAALTECSGTPIRFREICSLSASLSPTGSTAAI